jgi:hypothetical protein
MQLYAPDDGRESAPKHVESHINVKYHTCKIVASSWLMYLNRMKVHGLANVK